MDLDSSQDIGNEGSPSWHVEHRIRSAYWGETPSVMRTAASASRSSAWLSEPIRGRRPSLCFSDIPILRQLLAPGLFARRFVRRIERAPIWVQTRTHGIVDEPADA